MLLQLIEVPLSDDFTDLMPTYALVWSRCTGTGFLLCRRRRGVCPGRPRASSCPPPPHCLTPLSPVPSRFALSQQVLHCREASHPFLDGIPTHGPPAVATSRSRSGCGERGRRGDCTVCMYVEPIEVYAWRVHDVHVFACETACVRKCKPVDDRTITIPQQASVNEPTLKCEM